jgi:hypothetical protein
MVGVAEAEQKYVVDTVVRPPLVPERVERRRDPLDVLAGQRQIVEAVEVRPVPEQIERDRPLDAAQIDAV